MNITNLDLNRSFPQWEDKDLQKLSYHRFVVLLNKFSKYVSFLFGLIFITDHFYVFPPYG